MKQQPLSREQIVALDKRHVWHPYTPMGEYLKGAPLVIDRAEGVRLYDRDGRSYLDGNGSWWSSTLGHGHPRLRAVLQTQLHRLGHCALAGITHEPAAALAAALVKVAPLGLERVFFSDNGSTAVEVALKLCLQYWAQNGKPARRRFIALDGAYHGDTLGVSGLGGVELFRRPFAQMLPSCSWLTPPIDAIDAAVIELERVVREGQDEIAAVVLEPVLQGAAGMRIYPPQYLTAVREVTKKYDIFLVADEVFTGYGRTGPMWGCDHAGIEPDILCTAKGFTGGLLPMSATLVTQRIFEGFLDGKERAFYYGHTFCGNPLGSAVAGEVLRVYEEERVLEGVQPRAQLIREAFLALAELPGIQRVRSLGMMGALDLDTGASGYLGKLGWQVYEQALERGAYLRPLGDTIYITPALTIPMDELQLLLSIVEDSIQAVVR